ncbi:hypothetical protein JHK82_024436 [Glycine max]|nr:hypothetical protein JHK82_024436 [Glycine max]
MMLGQGPRKNELEEKTLFNLHKKKWTDGLTLWHFDTHSKTNEQTVQVGDVKQQLNFVHKAPKKWRFAFVLHGHPEYLQDSDFVSERFQRRDIYGAWEQYLGLEHVDSAPKRSYVVNQVSEVYNDYFSILQNHHTFEKSEKNYN